MKLPVIGYVADFSFVIPAIAGIIRFKHLSNAMKVFLLFCSFACVDVAGEMVLSHKNTNNAFLANYFVLGECAFIFTVYFFSIGSKKIKQIISSLAFLFLCIWMVDKIYFEIPNQLNVEMAVASRIFIIVISVFMIHTIVKRIDHPLTDDPMFWVSSSSLVYSAGVFLIIGLANELLKMGASYFRAAWYINWSLVIIVNVMYAKGFFCTTGSPEQIAQS